MFRCFKRFYNQYYEKKKKKKTELMGSVKLFSVDYRSINTNEILDIHKYLIKELL